MEKERKVSPWAWIPSLYYAQGIPYVVVMTVSVIMYKRLGISNTEIALYTSWLYLPWVIKPLWSPLVDMFKTKRWWIIAMQLVVGAGLAGVALTLPGPNFFKFSLAFLWLLAFSSATHDIAADGFYMLGLKEHQQAYFVGIRSTFYRIAMITGQGLLIIVAGFFEVFTGQEPVRFTVVASPQYETVARLPEPQKIVNGGELGFVVSSELLQLGTANITKQEADSIFKVIDELNAQNGFVKTESKVKDVATEIESQELETGATVTKINNQSIVVDDTGFVESWLRQIFGRKKDADLSLDAMQGNVVVIGVSLSASPQEGKEVVLNTGFKSGDGTLKLARGERLVFNSDNWNKAALVAVQVDKRLDRPARANFEGQSGNIPLAWSLTFFILAGLFLVFFLYHRFMLPRPSSDKPAVSNSGKSPVVEFLQTFALFFRKKGIMAALGFLLVFRLAEAQLVKMAAPFLLDAREIGGLGLNTADVGLIYGTIGILALTLGGILGGLMASKKGLKFWILPMTLAINLPNLMYVYLSFATPTEFWLIAGAVAIEQFGYGFGFTAYMLFMIYFADGEHKTAHFAICTGFMALGMMLPGMFSGWLQEIIGYQNFFLWVMLCTIPGFLIIRFLKIEKNFGIKTGNN